MNSCYEAIDVHVANGYGDNNAVIYDSPVTDTKQHLSYEYLLEQVRFDLILNVDVGNNKFYF